MTNAVPSLTELAAHIVIQNNDIDQLRPILPVEMIDYLRTVSGEIPLELATVFYDKYAEIIAALGALGDQQTDADVADHFLAEYQQLLLMHDRAAEALTTAIAAAVNATDPEWRQYLLTVLTEVQEHVTTLGRRVEGAVEYFTSLQGARTEYENWLDDGSDTD